MQTLNRSMQRSEGAFHIAVSIHAMFALCVVNLAVLCAACAQPEAAAPAGAIVVGVRTGPNNIDPRIGNDEASSRVAQLMFNQLFNNGDDLRPEPVLAERLDNPDPLTYIV